MNPLPHVEPVDWPDISPSRVAAMFAGTTLESAQVAFLGLPDDTGVLMNGGRVGAADGPRAFREALARYGALHAGGINWPRVADAGDIVPGETLDETHGRVTEAVSAMLDRGIFPIGIGGGHDLTFPFVRAVAARHEPMVGVYLDAHLDVRAEQGSGMPFRRLVEDCSVRELHVHGLDPLANTAKHLEWFQAHGGRVDSFTPEDPWPLGDLFVSFDLDVIDQAHAPGVSASNPCGWSANLADRWALAAGGCERVRCFDIMELNPGFDNDGHTARLAARLFLSFLRGFGARCR
jgi:formiminoglutamase